MVYYWSSSPTLENKLENMLGSALSPIFSVSHYYNVLQYQIISKTFSQNSEFHYNLIWLARTINVEFIMVHSGNTK